MGMLSGSQPNSSNSLLFKIATVFFCFVLILGLMPTPAFAAIAEKASETSASMDVENTSDSGLPNSDASNLYSENTNINSAGELSGSVKEETEESGKGLSETNSELDTFFEEEKSSDQVRSTDEQSSIAPLNDSSILNSGYCGAEGDGSNLTWELRNNGELVISGSGKMGGYDNGNAPWVENRETISSVVITEGVSSIGGYAFENCMLLSSITIPNSVTFIAHGAFFGCENVKSLYIDDLSSYLSISYGGWGSQPLDLTNDARLYIDNQEVTDLVIPDGVTSIPDRAFHGCTNITSISLPNSLTEISSSSLSDSLQGLEKVNYRGSVLEWLNLCSASSNWYGFGIFNGNGIDFYIDDSKLENLVIPDGVTEIPTRAFYGIASITSISIPSSVSSIATDAFVNFNLQKIDYKGTVEGWLDLSSNNDCYGGVFPYLNGGELFFDGVKVEHLEIPETVAEIPPYAFSGISSITSVSIPASVSSIGDQAFSGCGNVRDFYFGGSIEEWISLSANSNAYGISPLSSSFGNLYLNGNKAENIVIPEEVASIPSCAFAGCASLKSVVIPEGVSEIGESAFRNCIQLSSVSVPDSVSTIDYEAFAGCVSLNEIIFSEGLE